MCLRCVIYLPPNDALQQDDPTVIELENKMAQLTGKEAALFVASGVMANQLALRSQLDNFDSVILDFNSVRLEIN